MLNETRVSDEQINRVNTYTLSKDAVNLLAKCQIEVKEKFLDTLQEVAKHWNKLSEDVKEEIKCCVVGIRNRNLFSAILEETISL